MYSKIVSIDEHSIGKRKMQNALRTKRATTRQARWAISSSHADNEYTAVENGFAFTYSIDSGNNAHLIRCKGAGETLRIPNELGGCRVTVLEDGACAHLMQVAHIELPTQLERVGRRAFEGCLSLEDICLPESLGEIGAEAFLLCSSLETVRIPANVRHLEANIAGTRGLSRFARKTNIEIDARNEFLHIDENGVIYERCERGLIAVDGTAYAKEMLELDSRAVAVSPFAFAQNATIIEAILPEGLTEIGESAFRGCTKLVKVGLPKTLQVIRDAAFACTGIYALHIPSSCALIESDGLNTGAAIPEAKNQPYASTLGLLEVDSDNPVYCIYGGVLCKRLGHEGKLEAIMCVREADEVRLDARVERIASGAFSGTTHIGTLCMHDRLSFSREYEPFSHVRCDTIVIERASQASNGSPLYLDMPQSTSCRSILQAGCSNGHIDVQMLLEAYDEALLREEALATRSICMLARLAHPVHLLDETQGRFESTVLSLLDSLTAYIGSHRRWEAFRWLFEAGLMDYGRVDSMVEMLSALGDTAPIAYLLDLKQEYLGKACWDYEL